MRCVFPDKKGIPASGGGPRRFPGLVVIRIVTGSAAECLRSLDIVLWILVARERSRAMAGASTGRSRSTCAAAGRQGALGSSWSPRQNRLRNIDLVNFRATSTPDFLGRDHSTLFFLINMIIKLLLEVFRGDFRKKNTRIRSEIAHSIPI